jgi:hypothetical protein
MSSCSTRPPRALRSVTKRSSCVVVVRWSLTSTGARSSDWSEHSAYTREVARSNRAAPISLSTRSPAAASASLAGRWCPQPRWSEAGTPRASARRAPARPPDRRSLRQRLPLLDRRRPAPPARPREDRVPRRRHRRLGGITAGGPRCGRARARPSLPPGRPPPADMWRLFTSYDGAAKTHADSLILREPRSTAAPSSPTTSATARTAASASRAAVCSLWAGTGAVPARSRLALSLSGACRSPSEAPSRYSVLKEPEESVWLPLRSIASTSQS